MTTSLCQSELCKDSKASQKDRKTQGILLQALVLWNARLKTDIFRKEEQKVDKSEMLT